MRKFSNCFLTASIGGYVLGISDDLSHIVSPQPSSRQAVTEGHFTGAREYNQVGLSRLDILAGTVPVKEKQNHTKWIVFIMPEMVQRDKVVNL